MKKCILMAAMIFSQKALFHFLKDLCEQGETELSRVRSDFKLSSTATVKPSDNRNPPLIHYNLNYQNMSEELLKEANFYLSSFAAIATAFTSWQTIKHQYSIFKLREKICNIQKNEVLSVSQFVGRGNKARQIVLVKGEIKTKDGKEVEVKSGLLSKDKYALHILFTEAMYSNDSFSKENYTVDVNKVLRYGKIEGSTKISISEGNNSVLVRGFDQKDYSRVMEVIRWQENRRKMDFLEHLSSFFLSVLQALVSLGSQGKTHPHIRGIEVGKRDIEIGVKIGATATILGTVSFSDSGELILQAGSIFKDRFGETTILKDELEKTFKKRNFWLGVSLIGAAYLGRRGYLYCKKNNIKVPLINP